MAAIKADPVWHDFFYTELTTGLRRGELCGLQWQDFDAEAGALQVSRTLHQDPDGSFSIGETKTREGKRKILLRHLFVTTVLESGMDVKTLSATIGYVSAKITLNIYTHVTDAMRQTAAAKIDRGIGKCEPPVGAGASGQRQETPWSEAGRIPAASIGSEFSRDAARLKIYTAINKD